MIGRLLARLVALLRGGSRHDVIWDERAGIVDGKVNVRGRLVDFERDSEPPRH